MILVLDSLLFRCKNERNKYDFVEDFQIQIQLNTMHNGNNVFIYTYVKGEVIANTFLSNI